MDEDDVFTCEWCDQSFSRPSTMGPPPKYCSSAHRQRAYEVRQLEDIKAERDRLRAVVDVADDFWPLIESIYDQALSSWEQDDERMKYVTVQISKVDLPTLHAAYASREATDG
jgi:hypothetical protein